MKATPTKKRANLPEKGAKEYPALWHGIATLVILLGSGGMHVDTTAMISDSKNSIRAGFAARHAVDSARQEFIIRQNDTVIAQNCAILSRLERK